MEEVEGGGGGRRFCFKMEKGGGSLTEKEGGGEGGRMGLNICSGADVSTKLLSIKMESLGPALQLVENISGTKQKGF